MRKIDLAIAAVLAALAALLFYPSLASYAYPGESAHLLAVWSGLDVSVFNAYPLAHYVASRLSLGNGLGPFAGIVAALLLYLEMRVWIGSRASAGEKSSESSVLVSRFGAAAAVAIFLLTPAVRSSATHLEPRLFDAAWFLVSLAPLVLSPRCGKAVFFALAVVSGAMAGLGFADTPVFLLLLPVYAVFVYRAAKKSGHPAHVSFASFVFSFLIVFIVFAANESGDFGELTGFLLDSAKFWFEPKAWLLVAAFSAMPAAVALFSAKQSFEGASSTVKWVFHLAMTFASILAVATPLSPGRLMQTYGVPPVMASLFAAFTVGYMAAYWLLAVKTARGAKTIAPAGLYAVILVFTLLLNLFSFDGDDGAFADRAAEKIIDDLGGRDLFVTDGTLDDHLRIKARDKGVKLELICLSRDADKAYMSNLVEMVERENLGGDKNAELKLSLSLGVLSFVQDYLACDDSAASRIAVFGAPDLWYGAGFAAVPEFMFFGSDPNREPDWNAWKNEFAELFSVEAPKWGSYRLWTNENPVERMRLGLRRHLGLVANDRGVWLQDAKRDDEAFAMYELVLNEIDADNVCALFNEFEMSRSGYPAAAKKRHELEAKLKAIVDDKDRRYRLWSLGNYYGYIRDPEIFIRLGFNWARSGRPGDALSQIRRAIDFIPTDSRTSIMNLMAMLYANENDRKKSRATYEAVLAQDTDNHEALIGLMRLSLMDGDSEKAREYLEKATKAAGDDPRFKLEIAMLHLMKGEIASAKAAIRRVTDADSANMQAWSLLAAITIQEIDAQKDKAQKDKLLKSLEEEVLSTMEKQARSSTDYYLQTTRAFVLLQKGEDRRREARDALISAAKERPDIAMTSDMILGLDISLNDTVDAERHAREVLRRNRQAPLANYVMGSLSLQRGDYASAETYLRRAADAEKPVPLALNDLAEVLRRNKDLAGAERYARKAVAVAPDLYVAWETLASVLLDSEKGLDEAEECAKKAIELSKDKDGRDADIRMLITLARVQIARGDALAGKITLKKVSPRIDELSEYEKQEFERLRKSAK